MNRCVTSGVHDITPHENFIIKKPNLSHVRIFGSIAYAHIPDDTRQKFDPTSEKCILVGYSLEQKGYKCYNPSTRKVRTSRNVVFDEYASRYAPETTPTLTLLNADDAEIELQAADQLTLMYNESPITTRLTGPLEPPSDQSTSRPCTIFHKGKAKMQEYIDHINFDSEFERLDIHTDSMKKPIESANDKAR